MKTAVNKASKSMNKYEIDMCNGPLTGKILLFYIPLMLSGILQLLFNAADIIVVGRYAGPDALAAVGSTSSLINLIINLFIGLSIGANVLVARYYGSGQKKELSETVHTAILTSIISGILLIFIGCLLARPALAKMGTPDDVIDQACLYMYIYFAGMPATMLYNFGSAVLRAVGDTKRPLYYLSFAGIVNVILNLFFVICFHMNVAGVALATVISQVISALLVLHCLRKTESDYRLSLSELKISPDKLVKILQTGLPAGIQSSMFSISNVLIQSSINSFGSIAMAGNTAASNIEGFVFVSMNSFHQTAISFTGQNYGAKQYKRIGRICLICQIAVCLVGGVLGTLSFVFANPLLHLYSSDTEVIAYGIGRLSIIGPTYLLCGVMDTIVGSLRGMGYSVAPTLVSLTGVCLFRIAWISTVFQSVHTLECLYYSYPVSWTLTSIVHFICFFVVYRKLLRTIP